MFEMVNHRIAEAPHLGAISENLWAATHTGINGRPVVYQREDGAYVVRVGPARWRGGHVFGDETYLRDARGYVRTWSSAVTARAAIDESRPPARIRRSDRTVRITVDQRDALEDALGALGASEHPATTVGLVLHVHGPHDALAWLQHHLHNDGRKCALNLASKIARLSPPPSPVFVRKADGEIIDGKFRAGMPGVQVVEVDVSEEEARALALADNRIEGDSPEDLERLVERLTASPKPRTRRARKPTPAATSLGAQISGWITAQEAAGKSPTKGDVAEHFGIPVMDVDRHLHG